MYANDHWVLRTPIKQQTAVASTTPMRREMRKAAAAKRAELRPLAQLVDRREMLRIKLKSLMAEARFIRKEELRTHGPLREELHDHRINTVRWEARATHLAYGIIRGLTREQMEPKRAPLMGPADEAVEKALLEKVAAMVKKYGPTVPATQPVELKKAA